MFIKHSLQQTINNKTTVTKRIGGVSFFKDVGLSKVPHRQKTRHILPLNCRVVPVFNQDLRVFKKQRVFKKDYPKPMFFKNKGHLPVVSSLNSLIFLNCEKRFKFLLSRLFWNLKVTDHKFILLWLRRVFKYVYSRKERFSVKGLSVLIKGKLGVTGNKRTRTFKVNYGPNSSTKIVANTHTSYFTVRTTTGVIGFTTSITYSH